MPERPPLMPFRKPPLDLALREAEATAIVRASAGERRHATRSLVARAAPDGASTKLAEVESGASVLVLRSSGDWRYVQGARPEIEGWVDGRFLAGETVAADLAVLARDDAAPRR